MMPLHDDDNDDDDEDGVDKGHVTNKLSIHVYWATMGESLSLGFATRLCSNQPAQLQRLARILKLHTKQD